MPGPIGSIPDPVTIRTIVGGHLSRKDGYLMKKLIALLLVAGMLAVAGIGCGGTTSTKAGAASTPPAGTGEKPKP
jgi:hypothetical protein